MRSYRYCKGCGLMIFASRPWCDPCYATHLAEQREAAEKEAAREAS